jgi:two-component system, NtrC family, sensor kinase
MKEGLDRVKQLVLSLRTFSRLDEAGMKVVDVAQSIQSVLLLLNYTMKGRIAVQTLLDPECLLYCSGAKLNQLLMSLITNAVEAIAGTGTIAISGHSIREAFVISIRDTGKGIHTHFASTTCPRTTPEYRTLRARRYIVVLGHLPDQRAAMHSGQRSVPSCQCLHEG